MVLLPEALVPVSWLLFRAHLQYHFLPGFPSPSTALQLTPAQSDGCPLPQQLGALSNLSALGQHILPPSRAMLGLLNSFDRWGGQMSPRGSGRYGQEQSYIWQCGTHRL